MVEKMTKKMTIIYSPLCRGSESRHYYAKAIERGYELEEISVLDLERRWSDLEGYVQNYLNCIRKEGFIAGPLVFFGGRVVAAFNLDKVLREVEV